MKIGIRYNEKKVDASSAEQIARAIERSGHAPFIVRADDDFKLADRLIVLGGDGTVLHAVRETAARGVPIVGINYGRIGFLTEFERGDEEEAVRLVTSDRPAVFPRTMIEVECRGKKHVCLNEISVLHGVSPELANRAIQISASIDGSFVGDFFADGLIVATPTGSTAYALSAGGSIMTPDCNTFLLAPVCSLSMRSRPIVYSDDSVLEITLPANELFLYGDGCFLGRVGNEDKLIVKKSTISAHFITKDPKNFFHKLARKIN